VTIRRRALAIKALSLEEFIVAHREHFARDQKVQKDNDGDIWRCKCPCGKTWAGEKKELGVELKEQR